MNRSKRKQLNYADYLHIMFESVIGAAFGALIPMLENGGTFDLLNLKCAVFSGVALGLRKMLSLYLTDENGFFKFKN